MTQHSFSGRRRALALIAAGALAAPALVRAAGPADAPRVAAEEVVKMAARGEVVLVDTRGKADYDFEHAQGAINIPMAEFESRIGELPRDKYIAAYCT
jgi:predicted sulfurtransferase